MDIFKLSDCTIVLPQILYMHYSSLMTRVHHLPDNMHPIFLSDIIRFFTAFLSRILMFCDTFPSSAPKKLHELKIFYKVTLSN